jgi:hypothetical protein
MPLDPARSNPPPPDIPPALGKIRLHLTERVDPEAAAALWAMALTPSGASAHGRTTPPGSTRPGPETDDE